MHAGIRYKNFAPGDGNKGSLTYAAFSEEHLRYFWMATPYHTENARIFDNGRDGWPATSAAKHTGFYPRPALLLFV